MSKKDLESFTKMYDVHCLIAFKSKTLKNNTNVHLQTLGEVHAIHIIFKNLVTKEYFRI